MVGLSLFSSLASTNSLYVDGPRPFTRPERGIPRIVKLYFTAKIPALAQLRICVQMSSMLRSRSGLCPSMIAGICARSIDADVIVIGIMSSEMPYDSTRSRCFVNASTDHFSSSFADGMLPQMLLQPNAAIALRMASESPCCVPTLNFTFDAGAAGFAAAAGVRATCAETSVSASAPADIPLPASRTNSRRSIVTSCIY